MPASDSKRAADAVVSALEAQIMSGELPGDAPLPAERELMEQFGTSRTVIREAISTLSSRGLVLSKPRFRPVVRKPDFETLMDSTGTIVRHMLNEPQGVRNLYETRMFVERGLVRMAASSAGKEDIAQLKLALANNEKAIDDSLAFLRTDAAFHGVLYRIPQNPIYPAIHEAYSSWLAPQWDKMVRSPERNQGNFQAHSTIFEAILARDPDAAEEALCKHLDAAWEHVSVTFKWESK